MEIIKYFIEDGNHFFGLIVFVIIISYCIYKIIRAFFEK